MPTPEPRFVAAEFRPYAPVKRLREQAFGVLDTETGLFYEFGSSTEGAVADFNAGRHGPLGNYWYTTPGSGVIAVL